ncbi:MAG: hypothetical protein KKA67_14915 [Spirochaetes bacterium]|nr:hypothetical protein [Spirochaetota bacterium]MBU1080634.1 hypothetical protein [Spirochaetota bacterium]
MIASSCKYESLASKETFNASVRHVKATVALAGRVSEGVNLADAINEMIDEKTVVGDEVQPFVSMLLIDKFGYRAASKNMESTISDLSAVYDTVKSWNAFDIVVLYNHPDLGVIAVNPKNPAHASMIDRINKSELLVAYLGCFGKPFDVALSAKAADALLALYGGERPKENAAFLKGPCAYKAPAAPKAAPEKASKSRAKPAAKPKASAKAAGVASAPAPAAEPAPAAKAQAAAASGPKPGSRMTPMYGVLVTNELFHNGNVEAWKRIIDSFKVKHPDLDVLVYYDGERIVNLNALFKWGKVKHGSVIQFAVAGENICDVAKLQRYLAQGASSMFEAFLRGPVNGVLSLF